MSWRCVEAMSLLVGIEAGDAAEGAAGSLDLEGFCAEMAAEKSRVRTMRMVRRFGMGGSLEFVFCTENEWGGGLVNRLGLEKSGRTPLGMGRFRSAMENRVEMGVVEFVTGGEWGESNG